MDLESNYRYCSSNNHINVHKNNEHDDSTHRIYSTVSAATILAPEVEEEEDTETLLLNSSRSSSSSSNNNNNNITLHSYQQAETAFRKKVLVFLSTASVVILMMMVLLMNSSSSSNNNNNNNNNTPQDTQWLFDRRLKWPWGNGGSNSGYLGSNDPSNFNLDVEVTGGFESSFDAARDKWQGVITSDLPEVSLTGGEDTECGSGLKGKIDDLYICAFVKAIDGRGTVLGYAGPELMRANGGPITPSLGVMVFDSADVDWMKSQNVLDKVIVHEMGHVLGIGTLWNSNGLQSKTRPPSCPYAANSLATREYRRISGCSSATIPVETDGGDGTACGHWDEECFKGEIMTGYVSGNMAMSTMTLASLEDMGYSVDYNKADPYGRADMASMCLCSGILDGGDAATTSTSTTTSNAGNVFASPAAAAAAEMTLVISNDNEQPVAVATEPEGEITTTVAKAPAEPVTATEPEAEAEELTPVAAEDATVGASEPVVVVVLTDNGGSLSSNGANAPQDSATAGHNDEPGQRRQRQQRRQLSADGEAAALAFGTSLLQSRQANHANNKESSSGTVYVGGDVVVVLYEENGEVYHVLVANN